MSWRQILCNHLIYCMWKRYVGPHSIGPKRPNSLPLCRARHSSRSNKINSCRAAILSLQHNRLLLNDPTISAAGCRSCLVHYFAARKERYVLRGLLTDRISPQVLNQCIIESCSFGWLKDFVPTLPGGSQGAFWRFGRPGPG